MPSPDQPLVRVRDLHKRYASHNALSGLNLELRAGEVIGLLGANGAGKTTALQMLCGALAPSAGEISLCGHDLLDEPIAAKQQLGYLPDQPPLYPELSVSEYLRHCARLHRVPRRLLAGGVDDALQSCDLGAVRQRLIGNLSKGFRQRVGLAGALVHRPKVLVLDEPTTGLDPLQITELRALIARLVDERGDHCGVILSSHLMQEVQATCSRLLVLHRGRLLCDTAMREFAASGWLRARLLSDIDAAQLTALHTLREAQQDSAGWRLLPEQSGEAGAAAVARELIEHGIGLAALAPEEHGLEARFIELIRAADAEDAAA